MLLVIGAVPKLVMVERLSSIFILLLLLLTFYSRFLYKHSAGIRSVVDDEAGAGLRTDPMCGACEMAVVWMQNQLKQNKTQDLILNYINQVSSLTYFAQASS